MNNKKLFNTLLMFAFVSGGFVTSGARAEDTGKTENSTPTAPQESSSKKSYTEKTSALAEDNSSSAANSTESDKGKSNTDSASQNDNLPKGDSLKAESDAVETEAKSLVQQVKDIKLQEAEQEKAKANAVKPGDVRVDYVPEIVKQQIKDQLRGEVEQAVYQDILKQAETQRWGIPDANPEWFSRIKLYGDMRLRAEDNIMGKNNINALDTSSGTSGGYEDYNKINQNGGFSDTNFEDNYYNSWEDQQRYRIRARLGVNAQISTSIKSYMRISTGNPNNPVSTNQTMGQYGNRYTMVWDRLYMEYKGPLNAERQWLDIAGGRMKNPWFSTDLIWDHDLAFDGVAANFDVNLHGSESLDDINETDRKLFVTLGLFPLQEVTFHKSDKYLLGAQIGTHWVAEDQSSFKLGIAYYDFENISGERNALLSHEKDYTAPEYTQKGNLMFDIRNDPSSVNYSDSLWALASKYKELALTLQYDVAKFSPVHVVLTGEYVRNLGYDKTDIMNRTGGAVARSGGIPSDINKQVNLNDLLNKQPSGFQVKMAVGWPKLTWPGNWRASIAYKRVDGDAVLDAFTDSDFHMGGTNAKGWILQYERGFVENTWYSVKYISSQTLEGTVFDVDTIQLDINGKF